MPIVPEIQALILRLNQELEETEQVATEALSIVRQKLFLFPTNEILTQLFASLNNILFFVEIHRGRIQILVQRIFPEDVPAEVVRDAVEDLGLILGRVIEVKIDADKLLTMTQPSMTEHEVAELRKLLELAKTTERKAEEVAELILEIDRRYEKRLAQISVDRKLQL